MERGIFAASNMGNKRFRTLRLWHNALMMVWGIPFLVLPGVIAGASSGDFTLFQVMLGVSALGLGLALQRDSRKSGSYWVEDDRLTLEVNKDKREILMSEIQDSSLLDRVGARAYLREKAQTGEDRTMQDRRKEEFMRFCTVDIGLSSLTLGVARSLIDRLPSAKNDLLLLRLRGGEDLLLSPAHAHDLVDTLGRRRLQVDH